MEFFHKVSNIPFMAHRKHASIFSILLVIASFTFMAVKGLNLALDFSGGTQIELSSSQNIALDDVRATLETAHYMAKVNHFGSTQDILVRLGEQGAGQEDSIGKAVLEVLHGQYPDMVLRKVEYVGSEVGEELFDQGGLAILVALLATMVYMAFRFEWRLGFSAVIALLHDPIVILGCFAAFQWEFDLATLASILAVMGYSINDTVVVFDRVRENFRKMKKIAPIPLMDLTINQTLSRTIMTSFLTLLVVVALLIFGGPSLRGFSLAFLIGILIGTYSSIYIAGSLALALGLKHESLIVVSQPKSEEGVV